MCLLAYVQTLAQLSWWGGKMASTSLLLMQWYLRLCHQSPSPVFCSSSCVSTVLQILENTELSKWCKNMTESHVNLCWEICQVAMGNTLHKEHLLSDCPPQFQDIHYMSMSIETRTVLADMWARWFPFTNTGHFVSTFSPASSARWNIQPHVISKYHMEMYILVWRQFLQD